MKKNLFQNFSMFLLLIVCSFIGVDVSMAEAGVPLAVESTGASEAFAGENGGNHTNAMMSVENSLREDDWNLLSDFDKQVVKILPYKTPLDTLFRYAKSRSANSIEVNWVSADTPGSQTYVTTGITQANPLTVADDSERDIVVANAKIFQAGQTILVPTMSGYDETGTIDNATQLVLYVKAISGSTLTVMAVNGIKLSDAAADQYRGVPTIAAATTMLFIGMGPAAHELDVRWSPESVYLSKTSNYCQTFKCEVEVSNWYEQNSKLIDWNTADEKEMAKLNWKMKMERSFLLGTKGSVLDSTKGSNKRVYMCNGIVRYINKEYEYTSTGWTKDDFIGLSKAAFVGNSGSNQRVLFVGSDLMEAISLVNITDYRDITSSVEVYHGITFKSIQTNFGKIMILHHELLDTCGYAAKGILLDPDMLFKWVKEGENEQNLDNAALGLRNSKSTTTTETSCPGLKNPSCHLIVSKATS